MSAVFIHNATPETISGNNTYIDHPLVNDNPDAVLQVTQNWNPEGNVGIYNNHPIGVWYDFNRERWAIFNEDQADIPKGASFNVSVFTTRSGESSNGE